MRRLKLALAVGTLAVVSTQAEAQMFAGGIPAGWNCVGTCGTLGADGVVTLAPSGSNYGYISTSGGTYSGGLDGGTNGSVLSTTMSLNAGDILNLYLNFVSVDYDPFLDYAWARLVNAAGHSVILFSAAVQGDNGNVTPRPGLTPDATLDPVTTLQTNNGSTWAPLPESGSGYGAHTGWINSRYTVTTTETYVLQFGVTNVLDTGVDAGLAIDGQVVSAVPEPATITLLGTGLIGVFGAARRRRKQKLAGNS